MIFVNFRVKLLHFAFFSEVCSVKLEFESFTTTGVEAGANSKAEKNGGECSMDKLSIDVRILLSL